MLSTTKHVHRKRKRLLLWMMNAIRVTIVLAIFPPIAHVHGLTINKNTLELVNNGLKAIIGLNRLIHTIKSVQELSSQAMPHLAKPSRNKFLQRLFGKAAQSKSPVQSSSSPVQCESPS